MSQKKKDQNRTKAILSSCSHTAPELYLLAVLTSFLVSFRGRVFPFGLQEKGCSGWKGKGEISYENTQTHTLLVIPAQNRLEQEDLKFETNLGYTIRPCLKTEFNKQSQKQNTTKVQVLKDMRNRVVLMGHVHLYQSPFHTWITRD